MKKLAIAILPLFFALVPCLAQTPTGDPLKLNKDEAFVIINELPLYQDQGGALKWKESLTIGDKVQIRGGSQKKKVDGKERDYTKVKSPSGNEGYVRSQYIVPKAQLAVVHADKATIYSEPRDVKVTDKYISGMTIVAVLQDGSSASFAKVLGYDKSQDLYITDPVYIQVEDLTYADADVNASILFTAAMASKSKDIKDSLFKVIQKRYSSTIFFAKIQAAIGGGSASPSSGAAAVPPAERQTQSADGSFTVNDNDVNVRSQPDENSQSVAHLSKGAQVDVVAKTVDTYTVGDSTDYWYKISEPSGWVFGGFLDEEGE